MVHSSQYIMTDNKPEEIEATPTEGTSPDHPEAK